MKHELKVLLEYFGVTALIVTHNGGIPWNMRVSSCGNYARRLSRIRTGELVYTEDIKPLVGRKVTVLLRPDEIVHDDAASLRALVKRVAFRGMYRIYYLELPSVASPAVTTNSMKSGPAQESA